MSLALVTVESSDFDLIYDHLVSYKPPYRNMHLRESCMRMKLRDLRYLHAMHASAGHSREVEGMISGPGVFWHYKLVPRGTRTLVKLLEEVGDPQARARIAKRFLKEIKDRIDEERATNRFFPVKRTPGQFYLRRSNPGMPPTNQLCVAAISAGVLAPRFVSQLRPWGLELLRP